MTAAITTAALCACQPQLKQSPVAPPVTNETSSTGPLLPGKNEHLYRYRDYSEPSHEDESGNLWDRIRGGLSFSNAELENPTVQAKLNWYLKHPAYLEKVSERASLYLHHIVTETESRGMPTELALLPFVESAFNPFAESSASAVGMWQFMPDTGKHLGLKQTWWYDGRRDVVESTDAALSYLNYLNRKFDGDWLLALAAYNSGEGTVSRAIKKNRKRGRPTDFWSLDLPESTKSYVPQLIALSQLLTESAEFDITLADIPDTPYFTEVDLSSQIDLAEAAKMADISLRDLQQLNPGFSQWATAPNGPQRLLIPTDKADEFALKLDRIPESEWVRWDRYQVRPGDSLGAIAKRFGTDVESLRTVNKLSSNLIRVKQQLLVPQSKLTAKPGSSIAANSSPGSYRVQSGDSFWKIATAHHMSTKALLSLNNMTEKDRLTPGQTLKVSSAGSASTQPASKQKLDYTVKRGDTLGEIAKRHKVAVSDIVSWNDLGTKQLIRTGQSLTLYVQAN